MTFKLMNIAELDYKFMSSGTTKGLNLYILAIISLQQGFDLIVDEIENHFHKMLVENLIMLYKDKSVKDEALMSRLSHFLTPVISSNADYFQCRLEQENSTLSSKEQFRF